MPKKTQLINTELIRIKIKNMMAIQRVDYAQLSAMLEEAGYAITKSNAQLYIEHRSLSIDFLYALSKVFQVSLDYLVNEDIDAGYTDGFGYDFRDQHYRKYIGDYFVYFCPTRTNEQEPALQADFSVAGFSDGKVTLTIKSAEGDKVYKGWLLIAPDTKKLYICLRDKKGEIVQFIFNEQHLNNAEFSFSLGLAVSVSAGDLKRLPVAHRVCLSRHPLSDAGLSFVSRHLALNGKFIHIEQAKLKEILLEQFPDDGVSIFNRLNRAFEPREVHAIDERYMDTIKKDFALSAADVESFIASVRGRSMSVANAKVKANLDSRIFSYLNENGGFEAKSL